ncbi:MAG: hypothetical protein NC419_10050 [Muribaculaceae bacterium]|nr:hypothetical protein [Muribaculaceae bacterium]
MPEGGDGLELSGAPEVNPDKAQGDSHTITFADNAQVTVSENGAAFEETADADGAYTFKADPAEGYKITLISVYKDSDKNTSPADGETGWESAEAVAKWTEDDTDTDTVTYDTDSKTYSISESLLAVPSENFTIVIKSEQITFDVTVTLSDTEKSNITSWTYGINTEEATAKSGTFDTAIAVPYDGTLKIALTPADGRIATVMNGTTEVTAGTDGVYTIENIKANATITITTAEAPAETYDVTVEENANAEVSFDGCEGYADNKIAKGKDLVFAVTAKAGYKLASEGAVQYKIGDSATDYTTVTAGADGKYTISKDIINDKVFIKVTVEQKEEVTATTVKFNLDGVTVKLDGQTDAVDATTEVDLNKGGTESLSFTVEADADKVLRYVATSADGKSGKLTAGADDKYTFNLSEAEGAETTIYVKATALTDVAVKFDGTLDGETETAKVSTVVVADKAVTSTAVENNTVNAKENDTVRFIVEGQNSYNVTAVKAGNAAVPSETITGVTLNGGAETTNLTVYTVDLTDVTDTEYTVTIETSKEEEPTYSVTLSDRGTVMPGKQNTEDGSIMYPVDYDFTYTAQLMQGETPVELGAVKVLDYAGTAATDVTAAVAADKMSATMSVTKEAVGKRYTVELYRAANTGADAEADAFFYILVSGVLKISKVEGVSEDNKLTQDVDTQKTYAVTLAKEEDTIGANPDHIRAVSTGSIDAGIEVTDDGEVNLVVTTLPVTEANIGDAKGTIKLQHMKGDGTGEDVFAEIIVNTQIPAWAKGENAVTPTVKQDSATDVALTLELGAAGVTEPKTGKVWYQVEITPQDNTKEGHPDFAGGITKFYVEKTGDSQKEKVKVLSAATGKGQEWKFDVKVSLVQTTDEYEPGSSNTAFTGANTAEAKGDNAFSTRDPYFEAKLALKATKTKTLYTGQEDIAIATLRFSSANVSITDINVSDIESDKKLGRSNAFKVENGTLYMSVGHSADIGKHKITVTAIAPADTYPSSASITVTVVKGIETISLTSATDKVYKGSAKATLKTAIAYNARTTAPKTKKVTYDLVKKVYNSDLKKDEYVPYKQADNYVTVNNKGVVSINAKYTPTEEDDTFCVRATAADFTGNTVYGVTDEITITSQPVELGEVRILTTTHGWDNDETYYNVLKNDGMKFTSKQLNGAQVMVLKSGASDEVKALDKYTKEQIQENFVYPNDPQYLTFKSGNAKALTINAQGTITVKKAKVNNVKITVSANDGRKVSVANKNTSSLTLNIVYADEKNLAVLVEQFEARPGYSSDWRLGEYNELTRLIDNGDKAEFNGTTDTILKLTVQRPDEDGWADVDTFNDYTLKVQNAKALTKASVNEYGGLVTYIVANKQKATITLTNKAEEANARTKKFTIENTGWTTVAAAKVKADKSLVAGTKSWQQVTYKTTNVKNVAPVNDGNTFVKVTTDASDRMNSKKAGLYQAFENAADQINNGYIPVQPDGTFTLHFNPEWFDDGNSGRERTSIPAGSYKLQLTYGTVDEHGAFNPTTKTIAVTLKAVNSKKLSYKPVTSVKLSVTDKAGVLLTGKKTNFPEGSIETYDNLTNVIVNGKSNRFTDYFELVTVRGVGTTLKLKDSEKLYLAALTRNNITDTAVYEANTPEAASAKAELIAAELAFITGNTADAKAIRTGYMTFKVSGKSYTNEDADEYVTASLNGQTKITVTFTNASDATKKKTINKYTLSKATIVEGDTSADITVKAGKVPADIAYAAVKTGEGFSADADGSIITLSTKAAKDVGKYSLTLSILPADSYYVANVENSAEKAAYDAAKTAVINANKELKAAKDALKAGDESDQTAYAALQQKVADAQTALDTANADRDTKKAALAVVISQYGIEAKTDVTVVAANNKSGKKISISQLAHTFTSEQYDGSKQPKDPNDPDSVDTFNEVYWIHVPYTRTAGFQYEIGEITSNDKLIDGTADKHLISFGYFHDDETDEDVIDITMKKSDLLTAIGNRKTAYSTAKKKKTVSVKATINFGKWEEDAETHERIFNTDGVKAEEFTFKLTMPMNPTEISKDAKGSYAEVIEVLDAEGKVAEIGAAAGENFTEDVRDWNNAGIIDHAMWLVETELKKIAPNDSGVIIDMEGNHNYDYDATDILTRPTAFQPGNIKIKATLIDGSTWVWNQSNIGDEGVVSKSYTFDVAIPRLNEQPEDVESLLRTFVDTKYGITTDNPSGDGGAAFMNRVLGEMPEEDERELIDYLRDYMYGTFQTNARMAAGLLQDSGVGAKTTLRLDLHKNSTPGADYSDVDTDWNESVGIKIPTTEGNGKVLGSLHVYGPRYGGDEIWVPFSFTIPKIKGLSDTKDAIESALNYEADNNATEEALIAELEAKINAAINNKAIKWAWVQQEVAGKTVNYTYAAAGYNENGTGKAGSITGTIKLTDTSVEETADASEREATVNVNVTIKAFTDVSDIIASVEAVAGSTAQQDEEGSETLLGAVKETASALLKAGAEAEDVEKAVKDKVLEMANAPLKDEPFEVVYATTTTGEDTTTEDIFKFEAFTYKDAGSLSYTLWIKATGDFAETLNKVDGHITGGVIEIAEGESSALKLSADPYLLTLEVLAEEVKTALEPNEDETDPDKVVKYTNSTLQNEVTTKATDAIKSLVGDTRAASITVAIGMKDSENGGKKTTWNLKPATFAETGLLEFVLELTESQTDESGEAKEKTVSIDFIGENGLVIDKLDASGPGGLAAVKAEVERAVKEVGVKNEGTDADTIESQQTELVTAAENAVNGSGYSIKVSTGLAITQSATLNAEGSATITFTLKKEGASDEAWTITFTIAKLGQTIEEAKGVIEGLIAKGYENGVAVTNDISALKTEVISKVDAAKTGVEPTLKEIYSVAWSTEDGADLTAQQDDDNKVTAYKGTLVLSADDEEDVTIEVTLDVQTLKEAVTAACEAVAEVKAATGYDKTSVEATAFTDAVAKVLKEGNTAVFSTESGEAFAAADADGEVSGILVITHKEKDESGNDVTTTAKINIATGVEVTEPETPNE